MFFCVKSSLMSFGDNELTSTNAITHSFYEFIVKSQGQKEKNDVNVDLMEWITLSLLSQNK